MDESKLNKEEADKIADDALTSYNREAGEPFHCTGQEFGCTIEYGCKSKAAHSCTNRFNCGKFTE